MQQQNTAPDSLVVELHTHKQTIAPSVNPLINPLRLCDTFIECIWPALDALNAKSDDEGDPFNFADFDSNDDGYIDSLLIIHNVRTS